jgi:SAM-dependent methyltransferase
MSKLQHDDAAAKFRAAQSTYEKPWFKSTIKALKESNFSGKKCLDLCSGNCEFSEIMRDQLGFNVTCADYVPVHLDQARNKGFETISVDLDESRETVADIAQKYAGQFDCVVNLAAIEHVFNSDNLLQFAHTVLKPGGVLVVNTPNISFLAYRINSLFLGNRPFGEGHHIRFWDYRFLRTNLWFNGFSVLKDCRGFYSLPHDALIRAFRNIRYLPALSAQVFRLCSLLQKVKFFRGLASDELTVVCVKDDVVPIGFDYYTVKNTLEEEKALERRNDIERRLLEAYKRGWLKEHLFLTRLVETIKPK